MMKKTILLFSLVIFGFIALYAEASTIQPHFGAASVAYEGRIYITGGRITEPLCFNCPDDYQSTSNQLVVIHENGEFDEISELEHLSVPRAHHTAVLEDDIIYVFGGAGANNDIERYNITSNTWNIVEVDDDHYSWTQRGERPVGRWGHGSIFDADYLYIFGGFDCVSGNALNDFWTFNIATETWEEWPFDSYAPQPRGGFSFTHVKFDEQNVIILFGGHDSGAPVKYFNDLWTFDLVQFRWIHTFGSTPNERSPKPRAYHVASSSDSYFLVHGGLAANRHLNGTLDYFNDLWSINLDVIQLSWDRKDFNEGVPRPGERAKHTIAKLSETEFVLISGVDSTRETLASVWRLTALTEADKRSSPNHGHGQVGHQNPGHHVNDFDGLKVTFSQDLCFPGYLFPYCVRDCSERDWCNNAGVCLTNGTCCCDAGYSGDNCEYNYCVPYRGFTSELLNEILLPKSLESTYMKLDVIAKKLEIVRELLPNVITYDVDMESIAAESYNFYQSCLVEDLCETAECFEELVGCDMPCGTETFCLLNDVCVNNECVNGTWRDCSEEFGNNKCVHSWCDEKHGCMHSSVVCDDHNDCTRDYCNETTGCVHETITCNDDDCCTIDECVEGVCEYRDKCEDNNPCTIDVCNDNCRWGVCEYRLEACCHLSSYQNPALNPPAGVTKRPLGDPMILSGAGLAPPNYAITNTATAMFWLRACDCELIYRIEYDQSSLSPNTKEDGAHIHGTASWYENAGVVFTLPKGPKKEGSWNFCEQNIPAADLIDGKFYVSIYFNTGDIRTQITFIEDGTIGKRDISEADSFRG